MARAQGAGSKACCHCLEQGETKLLRRLLSGMALSDQPVQFRKTLDSLIAPGGGSIGAGTGGPVQAADHKRDTLLADVEVAGDMAQSQVRVLEQESAKLSPELGRRKVGSIRES